MSAFLRYFDSNGRLIRFSSARLFGLNIILSVLSGGYWVRRMRQLPRGPPETLSIRCRCFFEVTKSGRKVGNIEIDSR